MFKGGVNRSLSLASSDEGSLRGSLFRIGLGALGTGGGLLLKLKVGWVMKSS